MAYGTTPITATVPDGSTTAQVYGDSAGGGLIQAVKKLDSTPGSTTPIGTASNPEHVRPRRRGTLDYDSGTVAVPEGAAVLVTATTIFPEGGTIANTTTSARKVTITDGADVVKLVLNLQPEESREIPVPKSGAWAGWKIGAEGGAGVLAQIAGAQ